MPIVYISTYIMQLLQFLGSIEYIYQLDFISMLPSSHWTHPGVSRFLGGALDVASGEHADEAWT